MLNILYFTVSFYAFVESMTYISVKGRPKDFVYYTNYLILIISIGCMMVSLSQAYKESLPAQRLTQP